MTVPMAPPSALTPPKTMGAVMASFWRNRIVFVVTVVLGVAVQVSQAVHRFTDVPTEGIVATGFEAVFYAVIIYAIAGRMLQMHRVTMNSVFGVCSIYLLMAFAWSDVYVIVDRLDPDAFKRPELPGTMSEAYVENDSDLMYFSLITMTTVGYGDVTPASPAARTFAALQGVIGQLFLAVVLARIVSMEIGDRMAERQARRNSREGD